MSAAGETYAAANERQNLIGSKEQPSDGAAPNAEEDALPEHPRKECIMFTFFIVMTILTTIFFTFGFAYGVPLLGPLFLATLLPSFLIIYWAYHRAREKWHRTPPEVLVIAFGAGIGSTFLVVLLSVFIDILTRVIVGNSLSFTELLIYTLVQTYVLIAMVEEGAKYFVSRYSIKDSSVGAYICHPYGVVLYGLACALGFAGFENSSYVLNEQNMQAAWHLALVRAVLAVPLHGTTGTLIGVGLARRRFLGDETQTVWRILRLPVLIHGTYDGLFMLPFRDGPVENDGPSEDLGLANSENTMDIGEWLAVLYCVNMVLVAVAIIYAKRQADRVYLEYEARPDDLPV